MKIIDVLTKITHNTVNEDFTFVYDNRVWAIENDTHKRIYEKCTQYDYCSKYLIDDYDIETILKDEIIVLPITEKNN